MTKEEEILNGWFGDNDFDDEGEKDKEEYLDEDYCVDEEYLDAFREEAC